ncbi:MAG: type IV secretion system protein [Sulfurovum sp.]|nr:type IV secretion system protein [Sulfurovum sp.]
MKKIKILMALCILNTSSYAIPVIDAPQLFENGQTILRWGEQLQQWKDEIKNWKKDYDAITGFKLDGNILNKFMQINTLLKNQGLDMTDLDLQNPKSKIGVLAKQMFEEFTGFGDDCSFDFMGDEDKRICQDTIVREVQEIIAVKELTAVVDDTLKKVNDLNVELSKAKDIKTSQDITSSLASTFSTLEILSARLDMMTMKNEAKESIDKRRLEQLHMKKFEYTKNYLKGGHEK